MSGRVSPSQSELETLLRRAKLIRPVPSTVRARMRARARATVGAAATALPRLDLAPLPRRGLAFGLAFAVALAIGMAWAVVAVRKPLQREPPPVSMLHAQPAVSATRVLVEPTRVEPTPVPAAPSATATSEKLRRAPTVSVQESYAAELELLHRAQVAYANGEFSGALSVLAEHARRFPNGRLAEERDAIRVRALSGSGRAQEAQRASAAFAARFPRSVLLPKTGTMGSP